MSTLISEKTLHRLDVQGFEKNSVAELAPVAAWLRLAFGGCALLAGFGTALASPFLLMCLVPIALLGAISSVHPFDLVYNLGIRHVTGTGPLPRRGMPTRFACGMGSVWLLGTAAAFDAGFMWSGYVAGGILTSIALLVSTTDICIPSVLYRAVFGAPQRDESTVA